MKTSHFTESQIINILKQAEAGTPVPELCREHGMSLASFYKWRSKYGAVRAHGISVSSACATFAISQTCYRYKAKLSEDNERVTDW